MQEENSSLECLDKSVSKKGYEILCVVGKGTFGEAFLAQKKNSRRKAVVIKACPVQHAKNELKYWKRIKHASILPLKQHFIIHDVAYFVTSHCELGSLQRFVRQNQEIITDDLLRSWTRELFEALIYLHARNLVHLDIHPGNVLVDHKRDVLLADFGLMTDVKNQVSYVGGFATMRPPELFSHSLPFIPQKIDVWMAGSCLYFAATKGDMIQKASIGTPLAALRDLARSWTWLAVTNTMQKPLANFLLQALHMDPETRLLANEATGHDWFKQQSTPDENLDKKESSTDERSVYFTALTEVPSSPKKHLLLRFKESLNRVLSSKP